MDLILLGCKFNHIMQINSFLFLLFNLNIFKCASTDDQEFIEKHSSGTPSEDDIFSRHLNDTLLHRILQYDPKSTGRMALVNKGLQNLATGSRAFRFFEGAGWDMPEIANIWEFGVTDTLKRPELEAEKARIVALSHIKDETVFNETLETLLLKDKAFKELARPVLKYLVRRFYERKENLNDENGVKRQEYLVFAFENRLYDVFFELSKDSAVWNGKRLEDIVTGEVHDTFYFDCYNSYVYENPTASEYIFKKLAAIAPNYYNNNSPRITPGGEKLSLNELYAWIAVCIYRHVPEEKYLPYLSEIPVTFLDIIKEYIYNYSPITLDIDEKKYFHRFINDLLDKYFKDNEKLENNVAFIRLLNDIRFGYFNESFIRDRIDGLYINLSYKKFAMLSMAASKANNKSLVKMLSNDPMFDSGILELFVESKSPHSFKVLFDILEGESIIDSFDRIDFAGTKMIRAIALKDNGFKITKAIPLRICFGIIFEVQTPVEYLNLGFVPKYEIVMLSRNDFVSKFMQNMFDNAAKAGVDEFIRVVTEYCSVQAFGSKFRRFKSFEVSYEVIQLLLEHQELIEMLSNNSAKLQCNDNRIKPEEIANFRRVINPIDK